MKARVPSRLYPLLLAAVNFYICHGLFFRPFVAHMNSMHGEWLALARLGVWFSLKPQWWPYWGGGVPLEHTYAPLVPATMGAVSRFLAIDSGNVLFLMIGLVCCALPVTLYLLARRLTAAPGASFFAALGYSLLAPTEWLVPDAAFGWRRILAGRRIYIAVVWDELPHLIALALLPLLVLCLLRYFESAERRWAWLSGACLAVMMISNMFGFTLAAFAIVALVPALKYGTRLRAVLRGALIAAGAYLVVCPALPPSLLLTVRRNSVLDGEGVWNLRAAAALLIAAAGFALIVWLAARWRRLKPALFPLLFAWIMCIIPVLYQYAHMNFIPQPGRYKVEMEFALALLAAPVLASAARWKPRVWQIAGLAAFLVCLPQVRSHRAFMDGMLRAPRTGETIEYRTAKWLEEHFDGRRVLMGGSLGQWLNAFTRVPQLSGQPYTTTPNFTQQNVLFMLYILDGRGAEAAAWLKAMGVHAIGVGGPRSPEFWHSYHDPRQFEGVLPVLWSEQDTTIYSVPQRSASLGHIVDRASLVVLPQLPEVQRYVSGLEDASQPDPQFRCTTNETCSARAVIGPGRVLSVQINYHAGWRARVNGTPVAVERDGLGLMYVAPPRPGPCEIELTYAGSLEYKLCRVVSPLALLALVLVSAAAPLRRAA